MSSRKMVPGWVEFLQGSNFKQGLERGSCLEPAPVCWYYYLFGNRRHRHIRLLSKTVSFTGQHGHGTWVPHSTLLSHSNQPPLRAELLTPGKPRKQATPLSRRPPQHGAASCPSPSPRPSHAFDPCCAVPRHQQDHTKQDKM
jgi:hypothetical protein